MQDAKDRSRPDSSRRSKRRRAREEAVKALYEIELNPAPAEEVVNRPQPGGGRLSGEIRSFAVDLVQGVVANRDELDSMLVRFAARQRIDRMAVIDRCVLRLAAYELRFRPDIPVEVTLNEAVELAALFGDAATASFVNGLLDRMIRELDIRSLKAPETAKRRG